MADRIDVMISSTAKDLPEHRKQAIEAILRMSMHPIAMEHLPAKSEDAIDASLEMVDEAEIYLGIFAHRYGYIPDSPKNPDKVSITELEFRHAVTRNIPRLIFVMGDEHPITSKDLETDPDASAKLLHFKKELTTNYVVMFFNSIDQLREQIITSLAPHRKSDAAGTMHYISDIPKPPEAYIAHPYTLLQTSKLAGRQKELNLLTDWVAKPDSEVYQARILNIVAIGGMGKSALTWKWFNEIAPQKMKPMAGAMWWSFYESDARFENFVIRALAYVTGTAREDIEQNTNPIDRENTLLKELNEKPFLIVMDGLERILIAYARMDATYLADDDLDDQTANRVAGALGLPESAGQSFVGKHQLRKTTDPRIGNFLRKLASVKQSRILVSTRLYPADLQTVTGSSVPGSYAYFLIGLGDDDALELWRAMGVSGSRGTLLPLFKSFDNYPLLIRALAGEVARYRHAPGDFDKWSDANPDFSRVLMNLRQDETKGHVLKYALQGLDEKESKVLYTIAAFRMPTSYDTISALMIGADRLYRTEMDLDDVLADLEDRGLLGWDKRANRYDLHPVVRGVVWGNLDEKNRQGVYKVLQGHFGNLPKIQEPVNLEDLTPAIELYNSLIGLERYDDALKVFADNLSRQLLHRLSNTKSLVELLETLVHKDLYGLNSINDPSLRTFAVEGLALGYHKGENPGKAVQLYKREMKILKEKLPKQFHRVTNFEGLSDASRLSGAIYGAVLSATSGIYQWGQVYDIYDLGTNMYRLALVDAARGKHSHAMMLSERSLKIFRDLDFLNLIGGVKAIIGQSAIWFKDYNKAEKYADEAWELAYASNFERDFTRAARLQGTAALGLGYKDKASERLHQALIRARNINDVQDELPALIALAELCLRQGELLKAGELLADVWEAAERGPYPLFHADGLNVLAQIERDAGNTNAAVEAATKAYELAWCDGISEDGKTCYAYWWGLQAAKKHLEELGAPIPVLPPFDESKYEPLPEIDWAKLGISDEEK